MITFDLYSRIKHLQEQDLNATQISSELGLDVRTVEKWLDEPEYMQREKIVRPSKLDPFKPQIIAMLEKHPFSSVQVLDKIKEQGYDGGRSILKEYIAKIRPSHKPAYLTLHFKPGECAQVDWGYGGIVKVGNCQRKMYFFVMVLCYSRMLYVEFTLSQGMEFFLSCHQNAFNFFGGVPESILIDNLKTGVLQHHFGERPIYHPVYLDFAGHHGFRIKACNIFKPNEKGRAENAVRYIKCNFLSGLEIPDFSMTHPMANHWRDQTANVRVHGETHQKPVDMFETEKKHLKPVHFTPYDIGQTESVRANHQFRVKVDCNKYSIPCKYASTLLTLKRYPGELVFYKGQDLISRHIRSFDKQQDIEHPDHAAPLLQQKRRAKEQKIYFQFLNLSPVAEKYYRLLEEKRLNAHIHVRKIVALSDIYGQSAVSEALESALEFQAISAEYIENLLEQKKRAADLFPSSPLQVTHGKEMLDIELPQPDLNDYPLSGDPIHDNQK